MSNANTTHDNIIQLFKKEGLSSEGGVESVRGILRSSLDTFQSLSVMEKYNLHSAVVALTLGLMDKVHGEEVV